ncbi:MAG: MAPEG family protein [Pseudohongiellaceae bacterium]
MELPTIVIALALLEYMVFGGLVGRARGKYSVPAPATTGDPVFERYFRVHQNTLEGLVVFIPGMVMFSYFIDPVTASLLGLVYLVGRVVYLRSYVADPKTRGLGTMLSALPSLILLLGGTAGAVMSYADSPEAVAYGVRNDLPRPYETQRNWGELPEGTSSWAAVTAVEPSPDGEYLYVVHRIPT